MLLRLFCGAAALGGVVLPAGDATVEAVAGMLLLAWTKSCVLHEGRLQQPCLKKARRRAAGTNLVGHNLAQYCVIRKRCALRCIAKLKHVVDVKGLPRVRA